MTDPNFVPILEEQGPLHRYECSECVELGREAVLLVCVFVSPCQSSITFPCCSLLLFLCLSLSLSLCCVGCFVSFMTPFWDCSHKSFCCVCVCFCCLCAEYPSATTMKLNVADRVTGGQKTFEIEDDRKMSGVLPFLSLWEHIPRHKMLCVYC